MHETSGSANVSNTIHTLMTSLQDGTIYEYSVGSWSKTAYIGCGNVFRGAYTPPASVAFVSRISHCVKVIGHDDDKPASTSERR